MITAGGNNESNLTVSTIRFRDGTTLESAEYVEDFHVRKRFRASEEGVFDQDLIVEGDLIVRGTATLDRGDDDDTTHLSTKIDDLYFKIGWDTILSRWKHTHFTNVDTASLDYRLQEVDFSNYYTKSQTDNAIYFSNTFGWENYTGTGSDIFLLVDAEPVYGGPHIVLTANTSLVIPWGTHNGIPHRFIIQNSNFGSGKVLTSDTYGVATWQDIGAVVSVPQVIQTSIGPTGNEPSFKIHDLSTADYEFYPNKIGNNYEICQDGDFVTRVTQGAYSIFAGKGSNITRPTGMRLSNTDGSLTLFGGDDLSQNMVWMKSGNTYNGTYLGNTLRLDEHGVHITHAQNKHTQLYGSVLILPKSVNQPHYNKNPNTEVAKLHIGTASSGLGDLVVENKITVNAFQMATGSAVNRVLTCDAEGNASWQLTQAAASGISTFTEDVFMSNLTVQQLITTEIILSDTGNTILNPYNHAGVTWANGAQLDAPHPLSWGGQVKNIELVRNNDYSSDTLTKSIGTVTIPPNHRGTIKIHLPIYIQHQYNYKHRHNTTNFANEPSNETGMHYTIASFTTTWRDASTDQVITSYNYTETTPYSSHKRMIGSAYVQHHRSYSKTNVNSAFFHPYSPWLWNNDQLVYHSEFEKTLTDTRQDPHKDMQKPFQGFTGQGDHFHFQIGDDYSDNKALHTTHHIVHVDTPHLLFSPPSSSSSKQYSLTISVQIKYKQMGPSLYNGTHGYHHANTLAQRYPHMTLSFGGARPYIINWWRWNNAEGVVHIKDIQTGRYINPSAPYWTIDTPPIENVINPPYPLLPYFNLKKYPVTSPQFGYIENDHTTLWNVNEKKYVAFMSFADSRISTNSYRNSASSGGEYTHIVETSLEDGGYQPYFRVFAYIKFRSDLQLGEVYVRGNGLRIVSAPFGVGSNHPFPERVPVNVLQYRNTPWKNLEGFQIRRDDWPVHNPPQTTFHTLTIRILALVSNLPSSFPVPAGHPSGFAPQALPTNPNHDPVYLVRINLNGNSLITTKTYTELTDDTYHTTNQEGFQSNLYETTYPNSPFMGYENYISSPTLPPREVIQSSSNNQLGTNQFPNMDAFSNSLQLAHLFVSNLQAQHINTPSPIRCKGIYTRASAKETSIETELGNVNHVANWSWEKNGLHFYIDDSLVATLPPNFSDHRLKIDIQQGCPCDVFSRLEELPLFQYTLLPLVDNDEKSTNHFGFYAHELQSLFPEFPHLVNGKKNASGEYQSINYNQLVVLTIQALKDAKGEIYKVKKEVKKIKENLFEVQLSLTLLSILLFIVCYLLSYPLLHYFFPSLIL